MIRLPPTSIALSASDVDVHLKSVQIAQDLRVAGYAREQVQKILREQVLPWYPGDSGENSGRSPPGNLHDTANSGSPDESSPCGDASIKQAFSNTEPPPYGDTSPDWSPFNNGTSPLRVPSPMNPFEGFFSGPMPRSSSLPVESTDSAPMSASLPYRHAAVRQSSMLRFAQTAVSHSSDMTETDNKSSPVVSGGANEDVSLLSLPPRRSRNYRPRSRTYSFVQSEAASDTGPDAPAVERHGTPLAPRPVTPEDTPSSQEISRWSLSSSFQSVITLPVRQRRPSAPHGATDLSPSETVHSGPCDGLVSSEHISTPSFQTRGHTMLRSDYTGTSDLPSEDASGGPHTPPSHRPPHDGPIASIPSASPATSQSYRRGNALRVYDDRLPASNQPQTPADVSRHGHITSYQAAYTTPPAQGRTPVNPRFRLDASSAEFTPTAQRTRSRDEALARVRADRTRWERIHRNLDLELGMDGNGSRDGVERTEDMWLRRLDVDTVGEENASLAEIAGRLEHARPALRMVETVEGDAAERERNVFETSPPRLP